ncbi:MAG: hypothetical protein DF168_00184 [Candidatus Moanabacter tarae]|uniref:Uncharacterized protein n=1 Tax=Candidatus Moanibacter tarae TaxID=2200854 RepID=A0A2Z4AB84_9BACT|nr:MAG: hypothetical protein DF168_00184 [Candidatus Moanabacter tarae]
MAKIMSLSFSLSSIDRLYRSCTRTIKIEFHLDFKPLELKRRGNIVISRYLAKIQMGKLLFLIPNSFGITFSPNLDSASVPSHPLKQDGN